MERVAIFVDAGYLYAAGATAIVGSNQARVNLELNRTEIINKLRAVADFKTDNAKLLRIYWYDGVSHQGFSAEQQSLAETDHVKLRLGIINPHGQQKGVDSLIVTDIVELARNGAIADALLLSGDEDVRIGVQIAQSFGVRVHLLGVEPSRGNQSNSLRQETDTTTELSRAEVREFLTVRRQGDTSITVVRSIDVDQSRADIETVLDAIVDEFISTRSRNEMKDIVALPVDSKVPREFDAPLLAICRTRLSRELSHDERLYTRSRFREQARVLAEENKE